MKIPFLFHQVPPNSVIVKKGHNPDVDSYSAFFDNKKVIRPDHTMAMGHSVQYLIPVKEYNTYIDDHNIPISVPLQQVSHTELEEHLRSYGVTDCYVTGIATDVCVNATALHSIEIGFRTILVDDACRYHGSRVAQWDLK